MKRTTALLTAGAVVGSIALAVGYASGGVLWGVVLPLAWGALRSLDHRYGWKWFPSLSLILFVGMAAVGLRMGLAPGWMVLGGTCGLLVWDLDHYARHVRTAGSDEAALTLERRHLEVVLPTLALGLTGATVALTLRIRIGFGGALLLAGCAVLGPIWAVWMLRRAEKD